MSKAVDSSGTELTKSASELLNKRHNKKPVWAILFALWFVLIILSQVPFLAETLLVDYSGMDDTVVSHLSYPQDGKQRHYYVERYDTSKNGYIDVTYTTETNSLEVDCTNIKVLKIYCREMYENKCEDVFKRDPELDSNYYKKYFIGRDHFHVHVYSKNMITQLEFIDTPIPYNVTVNNQEWWLSGINYTYNNDGIVLTKVPPGHNYVDIYFLTNDKNAPVANFTTSKNIVGLNEEIAFDASMSYDSDGYISSYVWDFGEGTHKGGSFIKKTYSNEGTYNVILTVTDDDELVDRAFGEIKVVNRVMSITKSVDKQIATPGSILTYTLTPAINSSWSEGVSELFVTDELPAWLEYSDATPKPKMNNNTLTWYFTSAMKTNDIEPISLQVKVKDDVKNNTMISNYATLAYKGTSGQQFPQELSNLVNTKVNTGSIVAPRIVEPVPDITLLEDDPPYNLFLTRYEYDIKYRDSDLDWYMTDVNESLYILSGEYSDNDLITITPLPDSSGSNLVKLWLVNKEGFSTNQPLWINITPVNDKPIFSPAPDLIIHFDKEYTFDYEPYIFDIDTPMDQIRLFAKENVEGETDSGSTTITESGTGQEHIKVDDFKVTYRYPESFVNKNLLISLIAFDGDGNDGQTIQINVTDDYTPVLKIGLPDIWLYEGETKTNVFNLDDYFEDPDRDSLFYSFGETHVDVIINDDHSVDIVAPSDWSGEDKITFRARDPQGAIAEDTVLVTVLPINDPPVIEGVPDTFFIHYDADYSFDLLPYIFDEDNTYDELFLILEDEHIRTDPLNQLIIILNYPESMVGLEVPVLLVVSDGIDTASTNVTVKVTENWPPDILIELPDVSFYEDEVVTNVFNLNDFFMDRDGSALYYSRGQKNVNITIKQDGLVDFSAIRDWYGVEIVTFRATDTTEAFKESVITVTVSPVNDAPVIEKLPDQSVIAKDLLKFDLTNYISDIDNDLTDLTITVIYNQEKLNVIVDGIELLIYSNSPVKEQITVVVSDDLNESSEIMLIDVLEEKLKQNQPNNSLLSYLWLLILVIIILISLTGYTSWRRYVGNYRLEEIFWIHNDGVLLHHAMKQGLKDRNDEDILSGMLTGIIDFTQEAFAQEQSKKKAWSVKEIQMSEKNILIDRGKHTFLATVFTGKSGKKLYNQSSRVLNTIETRLNLVLPNWDGRMQKIQIGMLIVDKMLKSSN